MTRPAFLTRRPLWLGVAFGIAMAVGPAGCSHDHSPRAHLQPHVQRPPTAAVLISVDGLNVATLDAMLAAGELPAIRRLIDEGVRVEAAVSGYPTITYAQFTSIQTGLYAGHHGILGNKWFDRHALRFRGYDTMYTYRDVDGDFLAPTLYERLSDRMTVSIQSPIRRGVTRTIDNWASSGIRWFFGLFLDVDRLMPTRLEVVRDVANETGQWPALIHAYHPAVDEVGHRHGPRSAQYRQAVRNADRQVTRIREALDAAEMTDRTYVVLLSDHGFEAVDNHFDVPDWLRRERGLRVADRPYDNEWFEQRHRHFSPFDAVVINGGNRRAVIHLPGPGGWFERPTPEEVGNLLQTDPTTGRPGLIDHPGVELVARPIDADGDERVIELLSRTGRSLVRRRWQDGAKLYRFERIEGDALGDWTNPSLEQVIAGGWHDGDVWLTATIDSLYPDLVVQMVEMFDTPRAGDIVLFAEDGWDFGSRTRGGHGSITRSDMVVPMIVVGPGIPAGRTIPCARLVDVAPTLLHLVRGRPLSPGEPPFDGTDRAPELLHP